MYNLMFCSAQELSIKFSDKVDPRTGVCTRTYANGEVETAVLECGPNQLAIARFKSGDQVETEMPNLTLQLLKGVLQKVKPMAKGKTAPQAKGKPSKRPAAQEAEQPGDEAMQDSDDDSGVVAIEAEEATVAEVRKEWYKNYLSYGIKMKKDDGKWTQVMTVGGKRDEISQEKKRTVAEDVVAKLQKGMSVADAKHLAAEQLAK